MFDVDIQSAARPDFPVIRKQIAEGIMLGKQLTPDLQMEGKKINIDLMLKDYFATFDAIPDADKYITDMSQEEKDALAMQMRGGIPPEGGGVPGGGEGVPTEEAIATGAERPIPPMGVGPE